MPFASFLASVLVVGTLAGQSWQQVTTATHPPDVRNGRMVYDVARAKSVLFGGIASPSSGVMFVFLEETWEYDGISWIKASPVSSPEPRMMHAMAFDIARGRTVVFGGGEQSGMALGTWEYDGAQWTQATPVVAPQTRIGCQMAYDVSRGVCVLFGGYDPTVPAWLTDTWEWDGTSWTQITTNTAPPPTSSYAMSYDWNRRRTVLFGGADGTTSQYLNETWEYDGTNWVQIATPNAPSPRVAAEMSWDSSRNAIVLLGGLDSNYLSTNDCWAYDGIDWTNLTVTTGSFGMGVRSGHAMCYDLARSTLVLYGGSDYAVGYTETWELKNSNQSWSSVGTGCMGSAGVPALAPLVAFPPTLGGIFAVAVHNLPPSPGSIYMASGFNSRVWNGIPLPLALGAYGLPGCTLYVAPDTGFSGMALHGGSTAIWSLPIPNNPALLGLKFYNQALSFDSAAPNGIGAVTNAGQGEIY